MKKSDAALLQNPLSGQMAVATYGRFHWHAMLYSLSQFQKAPLASLLTALAMGISLALPAALDVVVKQVRDWSGGIQHSAQITLFLKPKVDDVRARQLVQTLRTWDGLTEVQYVTQAQAMEEFRQATGLSDVLDILESNPLPAQIRLLPDVDLSDRQATTQMINKLKTLPEVEIAEMDLHWLQRLNLITDLGGRALWVLVILFGTGVLVIAANSIRLAIQNQKESIEVALLVGATKAYVRRPFLYTGLWFGLASGLVAWICVYASLLYLKGPAEQLAGLFGQQLSLLDHGLDAMRVVPVAGLLGWLGARIGVSRYMRELGP